MCLLLDWLNTQPQDQPYVRAQITKYLQSVKPRHPLGDFRFGSRVCNMVQGSRPILRVIGGAERSEIGSRYPSITFASHGRAESCGQGHDRHDDHDAGRASGD